MDYLNINALIAQKLGLNTLKKLITTSKIILLVELD